MASALNSTTNLTTTSANLQYKGSHQGYLCESAQAASHCLDEGWAEGGGKRTVEQRAAACAASGPAAGVVPPVLSVVRQGLADRFAPAAGLRVIGFGSSQVWYHLA